MLAFVSRLNQDKGHSRLPIEICEQFLMHDPVCVSRVEIEPAFASVLVYGGIFGMAVRGHQVAVVRLLDPLRDGVDIFACLVRITVASDNPDDVVEPAITIPDISPPVVGLLRAIGEKFLDPAFLGTDIAEINRRQENLQPFFLRFSDHPVGVLEILFIRSGKIPGSRKWRLAIAVHGPAELVFDQINDDGIEVQAAARLQVLLGFFLGQARNQGPSGVALNQKRPTIVVDQMTMVRSNFYRIQILPLHEADAHEKYQEEVEEAPEHHSPTNGNRATSAGI